MPFLTAFVVVAVGAQHPGRVHACRQVAKSSDMVRKLVIVPGPEGDTFGRNGAYEGTLARVVPSVVRRYEHVGVDGNYRQRVLEHELLRPDGRIVASALLAADGIAAKLHTAERKIQSHHDASRAEPLARARFASGFGRPRKPGLQSIAFT